jgi:hypothetical protein
VKPLLFIVVVGLTGWPISVACFTMIMLFSGQTDLTPGMMLVGSVLGFGISILGAWWFLYGRPAKAQAAREQATLLAQRGARAEPSTGSWLERVPQGEGLRRSAIHEAERVRALEEAQARARQAELAQEMAARLLADLPSACIRYGKPLKNLGKQGSRIVRGWALRDGLGFCWVESDGVFRTGRSVVVSALDTIENRQIADMRTVTPLQVCQSYFRDRLTLADGCVYIRQEKFSFGEPSMVRTRFEDYLLELVKTNWA